MIMANYEVEVNGLGGSDNVLLNIHSVRALRLTRVCLYLVEGYRVPRRPLPAEPRGSAIFWAVSPDVSIKNLGGNADCDQTQDEP